MELFLLICFAVQISIKDTNNINLYSVSQFYKKKNSFVKKKKKKLTNRSSVKK